MAAPARSALFGRPVFSGASAVVVAVMVAVASASASVSAVAAPPSAVAVVVAPPVAVVAPPLSVSSSCAFFRPGRAAAPELRVAAPAGTGAAPFSSVEDTSPDASPDASAGFFGAAPAVSSGAADGSAAPAVPLPSPDAARAVRTEVSPVAASEVAWGSGSEAAAVSSFLDVVMGSSG